MFTNDIGKSNYINYALYRDPIEVLNQPKPNFNC